MNRYFAPWALLPDGWHAAVVFEVDDRGTLAAVVPGSSPAGATLLNGIAIPGMANAHSHAFQRVFAGYAEGRGADDFLRWRDTMYDVANRLDAEAIEAVTAAAYVEMLEAGYTSAGEFHYLHHAPDGTPYPNPIETWERVAAAAHTAGIGLTLLPALYRFSDAGGVAPLAEQRRFVHSVESFVTAWRLAHAAFRERPGVRLGVAFHSIRAIDPRDVRAVIEPLRLVDKSLPIHAHASEQRREVERCREAYGQTPIALLLADAPEPRLGWSIVHATHATAEEIALMTAFVTVVLAPTTEANLGDGIFAHAAHEGFTAIGSDSHVAIDVAEEVRWLEYGQRLRHERRMGARPSPLAGGGDSFVRSLGDRLYADLALCGALSLGRRAGLLTAGASADVVVLAYDAVTPPSLDVPIFRSGAWRVRDVFSRGRQVVRNGAHERRGAVMARAASALERCGLRFGW